MPLSIMHILIALATVMSIGSCSRESPAPVSTNRWFDAQQAARGARLFQENCATCHGTNAQGAPNWQQRGADGKYPAPPLNGTGHAWHHPLAALKAAVRNGTLMMGGSMPPWRDKLSDAEIEAIIGWLQSLWPEEIYAAWKRMDDQARQKQRGS
jgi:mono/diheme cytochrome c family protein